MCTQHTTPQGIHPVPHKTHMQSHSLGLRPHPRQSCPDRNTPDLPTHPQAGAVSLALGTAEFRELRGGGRAGEQQGREVGSLPCVQMERGEDSSQRVGVGAQELSWVPEAHIQSSKFFPEYLQKL